MHILCKPINPLSIVCVCGFISQVWDNQKLAIRCSTSCERSYVTDRIQVGADNNNSV